MSITHLWPTRIPLIIAAEIITIRQTQVEIPIVFMVTLPPACEPSLPLPAPAKKSLTSWELFNHNNIS